MYVEIIGAEEAAPAPAPAADEGGATAAADGAAVARIDVSDVGDATTTRWAVAEPGGGLAVRTRRARGAWSVGCPRQPKIYTLNSQTTQSGYSCYRLEVP